MEALLLNQLLSRDVLNFWKKKKIKTQHDGLNTAFTFGYPLLSRIWPPLRRLGRCPSESPSGNARYCSRGRLWSVRLRVWGFDAFRLFSNSLPPGHFSGFDSRFLKERFFANDDRSWRSPFCWLRDDIEVEDVSLGKSFGRETTVSDFFRFTLADGCFLLFWRLQHQHVVYWGGLPQTWMLAIVWGV